MHYHWDATIGVLMKAIVGWMLILCVSVMGAEHQHRVFVGVDAIKMKQDESATWSNVEVGARVGLTGKENRGYFLYQHADGNDILTLNLEGFSGTAELTDWLKFRAFVGVHGGAAHDEGTDSFYGAQLGGIVDIPADFQLEAGFRYSRSGISTSTTFKTVYGAVNYCF